MLTYKIKNWIISLHLETQFLFGVEWDLTYKYCSFEFGPLSLRFVSVGDPLEVLNDEPK